MSEATKVEVYLGRYDMMEGLNAQGKEVELRCSTCRSRTHHSILASAVKTDWGDEEQYVDVYQIAECRGCKTLSFVHTPFCGSDYRLDPATNNEEPALDLHQHPGTEAVHHVLEGRSRLPEKVLAIYNEAIFALNHEQRITAGFSLRAVVEAACADKGVSGGGIAQKITSLVEKGLVTKASSERLQLVRDLGNDAVHEVRAHPTPTLLLMLVEVNHLLRELYVQPRNAEGLYQAKG